MFQPESDADSSVVSQQTRGPTPEALEQTDGPERECELCESERQLHEEYGMAVCAACDEKLLP